MTRIERIYRDLKTNLIGANLPQLKKTVIPEALLIGNPDF